MATPAEQLQDLSKALETLEALRLHKEFVNHSKVFLTGLIKEIKTGTITPETIEELLSFLNQNRELINAPLPQDLIDQQIEIRQMTLKILARVLNTAGK